MSQAFEIDVDVSQLGGLEERLAGLASGVLGRAALEAVNAVTTRFDDKQRAGQLADIALSPAYVASKTAVRLASNPAEPRATITTRGDLTVMDRYPLESLRDPERRDRAGRRMGARQAGVTVTIKPSAPTTEPQWFLMRLKNGNGTGVFVRTSSGRTKHLYGPSPYSLFRHQVAVGEPELQADLQVTSAAVFADAIERALK